MNNKNKTSFILDIDDEGIAYLTFDLADSKVNILRSDILLELDTIIKQISQNNKIKTLIFESAKANNFIAGADISEIESLNTEKDAIDKVSEGQRILSSISKLRCNTICYINGTTMGGGTELALCFDYRISSKSNNIKIALPEVSLGVIPGFGGTQRLPRLIGLIDSLPLILSGKVINYKKAYKIGLIDSYFPAEYKKEKINEFIKLIRSPHKAAKIQKRRKKKLIDKMPIIDALIYRNARKNVMQKTSGHYPAPLKALEVIEQSYRSNLNNGLKIELKAFSELVVTDISKNLIGIYYANEALKKDNAISTVQNPIEITQAATLGAGIMGGGIAWLLSKCDIPVRIKDLSLKAVALGYKQVDTIYRQLRKIRKYNDREISLKKDLVTYSLDYKGFDNIDLIIEAIIEDIDIKKNSFTELEKHINDNTIVASNTSALSITEMSKAFKIPKRFVGMHFFNPVNRMPLIEVIPHSKTDKAVTKAIIELSYKTGKTPILVKDSPGFLVNRILLPYLNEAAYLLDETSNIERIDEIIKDFGMPMGPLTLADNVGIDVGYKVAKILEDHFGERMKVSPLIIKIYKDFKLLGKKSGEGFYLYKSKNLISNDKIRQACHSAKNFSKQIIIDRLILIMINEAAKCIEEKIVAKVEHLDMAMIMGTGFPAFRGGLLRYADNRGIANIVRELENFTRDVSARYKPTKLLIEMASNNQTFYKK
ncbi:MAG: fatty-acid oxidation protein subunit alpha [Rickettsiales bacterium]|nr:fatty-acid oxidation protein subunit alpha [Rickettsiales bacterium]